MKKLVPLLIFAPLFAQEQGGGDIFRALLPLIFIFVIFYLLLIYPQSKAEKKRKAMLAALKNGDRVITSGGIIGTIQKIDNNIVNLKVGQVKVGNSNQSVVIKVEKSAIRGVLKSEAQEEKKEQK